VVYASACSGIYKSESGGELFQKIQGIPFSARRTRVLKQDPANSAVVYAGTTEGLWKTSDSGRTWKRITSGDVIVNDVLIEVNNRDHILLATDRSGVLASHNGGSSFEASNLGFAHRQVASLAVDPEDQKTLYAGLINDKQYGGIFISHDQGAHWKQMSAGLDGRDVFALRKAGPYLLAGTSSGVFKLEKVAGVERWRAIDRIANETLVIVRPATKRHKALARKEIKVGVLKARVTDLQVRDGKWIAASTQGIFTSSNLGRTWEGGALLGHSDFTLFRSSPKVTAAGGRNFLLLSVDAGSTWYEAKLPKIITAINDLAFGEGDSIWLACREGLYRSNDAGDSWERVMKLPVVNLASVLYDGESKRVLVTAMNSTEVFSSADEGRTWKHRESGWLLRTITQNAGMLVASTAFDGIVIERPATEAAQSEIGSARSQ
jgi:photosystem II stability/assembly factor-like uncharacterized protein